MSKTLGSLPVGTLVQDLRTRYYGEPIVWQIADKNHSGYPANSTTLITHKIIKIAGFDGKEADNADVYRASYGSNRYRTSNLRQWLNSEGAANEWWTAQNLEDGTENTNNKDAPPTSDNMCTYNGYDTEKGFLTWFSSEFKAALLPTTLTVAKNTVTDGGGSETVEDKIFLASCIEVGFANENNIAEGSRLAIFDESGNRISKPTEEALINIKYTSSLTPSKACAWWLRTPTSESSYEVHNVTDKGMQYHQPAYEGERNNGVRPLCNLSSDILVPDTPNSEGIYILGASELKLSDMNIGDIIKIKEKGVAVNYLIVHKGLPSSMYDSSCDGVWVLRQQPHSGMAWDADNKNDYENSDIKAWLNDAFLNTIDSEIRNKIKTVKIPYKVGVGNDSSPIQTGSSGLSCKAFLLSGYEAGGDTNSYYPADGSKLNYFSNGGSTICKIDYSNRVAWWFRSPYLHYNYRVCGCNAGGSFSAQEANYIDANSPYMARPAFILPFDLSINSSDSVVGNVAPTITSDKIGDLGTLTDGFACNYSVDDADAGDEVSVTLAIDDAAISTFTAIKGQQYTYSISGTDWLKLDDGSHRFRIIASDGKKAVESTAIFVRACDSLSTTLSTPLSADDLIKTCSLKVVGVIPDDAVCCYEVTNNANDTAPVWEDCTESVKSNAPYTFSNRIAENGFAFNFRVAIQRGTSGASGYIIQVSGGFE